MPDETVLFRPFDSVMPAWLIRPPAALVFVADEHSFTSEPIRQSLESGRSFFRFEQLNGPAFDDDVEWTRTGVCIEQAPRHVPQRSSGYRRVIVGLVHRRAVFWIDRATVFERDLGISLRRETWNPVKRMIRTRHHARKHPTRHGRDVEHRYLKAMHGQRERFGRETIARAKDGTHTAFLQQRDQIEVRWPSCR